MTAAAGTSEYDRFGPWVDEVSTPDDVPRLYRGHPLDLGTARLVLKVPRNIARRDATADMDLYDHLVVLDADRLTVLSRRTGPEDTGAVPGGEPYAVRTVELRDVVAVRDVVSMLDAVLTVHVLDGRSVAIRYNGSARQSIDRLVAGLRESVVPGAPTAAARALVAAAAEQDGPVLPGPDDPDVAIVNDFGRVVRANPALTAWAWHGRRRVAPRGGGAAGVVQGLLHVLSPMTLHGAVLAGDGGALEVLGRHEWLVRGRGPVHSGSRLIVPFAALDRVEAAEHPRYAGTVSVVLRAGLATVDLVLPTGSPTHRLLTAADRTGVAAS